MFQVPNILAPSGVTGESSAPALARAVWEGLRSAVGEADSTTSVVLVVVFDAPVVGRDRCPE